MCEYHRVKENQIPMVVANMLVNFFCLTVKHMND